MGRFGSDFTQTMMKSRFKRAWQESFYWDRNRPPASEVELYKTVLQ